MKLMLSSSPHAHAKNSVCAMMRDVIIALLPATGCAMWFFGMRAVWLVVTCIAASLVTEAVCRMLMKRENSIGDLSAVLTGLLLALNLPPGAARESHPASSNARCSSRGRAGSSKVSVSLSSVDS